MPRQPNKTSLGHNFFVNYFRGELSLAGHSVKELFLIHPIPQLLPRLEMRNEFAVEADGLAGLGVAADAGGAVVQGETAEAADLDPLASAGETFWL